MSGAYGFFAVIIISGILAQKWKGRTGILWAILSAIITTIWYFVVYGVVEKEPSVLYGPSGIDAVIWTASIVSMLCMLGIIASLPSKLVLKVELDNPADIPQPQPQADDRFQCPRCAETIKKAAKVCRFCGYEIPNPEGVNPSRDPACP